MKNRKILLIILCVLLLLAICGCKKEEEPKPTQYILISGDMLFLGGNYFIVSTVYDKYTNLIYLQITGQCVTTYVPVIGDDGEQRVYKENEK